MNQKKSPAQGNTLKLEVSSIGDLTIQLLTTPINPEAPKDEQVRLSNEEIASNVTRIFPNRKANGAKQCVAWYATKLKNDPAYRAKHGGKEPLPARGTTAPKTVEIPLTSSDSK